MKSNILVFVLISQLHIQTKLLKTNAHLYFSRYYKLPRGGLSGYYGNDRVA